MFAFVATAPLETRTTVPPSRVMSFTSNVEPTFRGGRNVTIVYERWNSSPATDVVDTFHWPLPNSRAKWSWKDGFDTVTWTERAGSQDAQLAADGRGVTIDAV